MKYQISKGSKAFGASVIFRNIQFEIRNNEKIAVVGPQRLRQDDAAEDHRGGGSLDSGDYPIRRMASASAIWRRRPLWMKDRACSRSWNMPLII